MCFSIRRKPDTYPVRTPDIDKSGQYLSQEPGAIFDAAAILVLTQVSTIPQKLVDQIAIRAVQLHTIEAGFFRILRRLTIVFDHASDLLLRQFARLLVILTTIESVSVSGSLCCACRYGCIAAQEVGMYQTAHMPHLENNLPTLFVHRIGNQFPAFDLLFTPDTWRGGPSEAFDANACRFRNDETSTCTLAIIGGHHFIWDRTWLGGAGAS